MQRDPELLLLRHRYEWRGVAWLQDLQSLIGVHGSLELSTDMETILAVDYGCTVEHLRTFVGYLVERGLLRRDGTTLVRPKSQQQMAADARWAQQRAAEACAHDARTDARIDAADDKPHGDTDDARSPQPSQKKIPPHTPHKRNNPLSLSQKSSSTRGGGKPGKVSPFVAEPPSIAQICTILATQDVPESAQRNEAKKYLAHRRQAQWIISGKPIWSLEDDVTIWAARYHEHQSSHPRKEAPNAAPPGVDGAEFLNSVRGKGT